MVGGVSRFVVYFSGVEKTSISSYSGFMSALSSSAWSIAAVSSEYASARMGVLLCTCTTMWICGCGVMGGSSKLVLCVFGDFGRRF